MRVLGYTWAGVRTADLKSTTLFFADVLGFSVIHKGEGLVQFEMPSGQLFEVFGSRSRYYQLHACPVLGFSGGGSAGGPEGIGVTRPPVVTDVDGNESEAWTYFRGPDGYQYQLGIRLAL